MAKSGQNKNNLPALPPRRKLKQDLAPPNQPRPAWIEGGQEIGVPGVDSKPKSANSPFSSTLESKESYSPEYNASLSPASSPRSSISSDRSQSSSGHRMSLSEMSAVIPEAPQAVRKSIVAPPVAPSDTQQANYKITARQISPLLGALTDLQNKFSEKKLGELGELLESGKLPPRLFGWKGGGEEELFTAGPDATINLRRVATLLHGSHSNDEGSITIEQKKELIGMVQGALQSRRAAENKVDIAMIEASQADLATRADNPARAAQREALLRSNPKTAKSAIPPRVGDVRAQGRS